MSYFKVIQNGEAINAGEIWLYWNTRHNCLMACEAQHANYGQSYDGETIYRIGWLNPLPEGAPVYPTVEAREIDAQEYADLIEVLDDGETVPEPVEPDDDGGTEPDPDTQPEPEPERKMTVQEMREIIAELTSMAAKDDIPQGSYFVLHDEVYLATDPITKGSAIKPGYNCEKKTLDECISREDE